MLGRSPATRDHLAPVLLLVAQAGLAACAGPRPPPPSGCVPGKSADPCPSPTKIDPHAELGFATGELFVLGFDAVAMVATSPEDVYVGGGAEAPNAPGGRGFVWRYDGKAWSALPQPGEGSIESIAVDASWTLWVVARTGGNQLWTRPRGGGWTRVAVLDFDEPQRVWALQRAATCG